MSKPRRFLLVVVVPLLGIAAFFWLSLMGGWQRIRTRSIIVAVEEYRLREGRLPDPEDTALLQSLGFEVRVGLHPDYQPVSSTSYILTIFEGFDGPYWIYESSTDSWRQGFPPERGGSP